MNTSPTIDDLLVYGTPADVREDYLTLKERAHVANFGPLQEGVVVLDTETTGLSFATCELIEISAARLQGTTIVERFETFVKPKHAIPAAITKLTSITNEQVEDAPLAREAVAALAEFVGGAPVIAHNATFDKGFITRVAGGDLVSDVWIDSLSLSRMALPALTSHRLADMAAAFECAAVSHRACDDVDALCGMWPILLQGLADLPQGLLSQIAQAHPDVAWAPRPIVSFLADDADGQKATGFSLVSHRAALVEKYARRPRQDASDVEKFTLVEEDEIRAAFGADGVASRMYARLEERPEQLAMSLEVARAFSDGEHRAIEAGTGVGKSFAYLLPAALFARKNGVGVGIATKTNALTDQLIREELPALNRALPGGLDFVSVKGFDHYPCLRRVQQQLEAPESCFEGLPAFIKDFDRAASEQMTALAVILATAAQLPLAELTGLGIQWNNVPSRMVVTTSDECRRYKCPFYKTKCLVHGARQRAKAADIVVTNHAMLMVDAQTEGRVLPSLAHWVIDEAHNLEAEARSQWAYKLSAHEVRQGFEQLGGTRTGALGQALRTTPQLDNSTLVQGLLTKAASDVAAASVATAALLDAIHGLSALAPYSTYDVTTLWIGPEAKASAAWDEVRQAGYACADTLSRAAKTLGEGLSALASAELEVAAQAAEDLRRAAGFLNQLDATVSLICDGTDKRYVYSAEVASAAFGRAGRGSGSSSAQTRREALLAARVDVGEEIAEKWLSQTRSAILTSATITVDGDFSHFVRTVGLDEPGVAPYKTVQLASSFDFDQAMDIVVARDIPEPNNSDYLDALVDMLFDVHVAMGGSTLSLFTNRRDMERAYKALKPRLEAEGLKLECQDGRTSAAALRRRFKSDEALSLMALKSFWEGFDAAGNTLRCVVIARLPFSSPTDPLVCERKERDPNSWRNFSLPEAVISVRQAAGRLIRSATDTGVLVLADSRVATKGYGKKFVGSLPSRSVHTLDAAAIGEHIATWREAHEGR